MTARSRRLDRHSTENCGSRKDNPVIDIAWMDGGVSELAAGDGLLADLTAKSVPNLDNMLPEGIYKTANGSIYALSTGFYSMGLVYNTKEAKRHPPLSGSLEAGVRRRCHRAKPDQRDGCPAFPASQ